MLRVLRTIAALATMMSVAEHPVPAQGAQSLCVTNPDTTDGVRVNFHQLVAEADSVSLAKLGLPYRPVDDVAVIADEATCGLAVNAFNGLYQSDSSKYIARALVMRVGANRYVVWGVRPRSSDGRDLYFVFDQTFQFVKLIA